MKSTKNRPPRLYRDKKGRYIKLYGKKIYVNSPFGNQQLVKVIINNFEKKYKKGRKMNPGKRRKTQAF